VIDASTGRPLADLVEIDSTVKPEKANVEIHPARQLHLGSPLYRRLAKPQKRNGQRLQAPAGFRFTGTTFPPRKKRSTNAVRTSKKYSRSSKQRALRIDSSRPVLSGRSRP